MRTLRVTSGTGPDRVELAVRVHERDQLPASAPTVLLVHGYPDTMSVWDPLVERLAAEHRVVSYDVRGAGASTAPRRRAGYLIARLVDDLVAVLDAVLVGHDSVHVVAHDWGSVALWDAVCFEEHDLRLRGRIGSYVSISGPSPDHVVALVRESARGGNSDELRRQRRKSWYVAAFHLPLLPELVWTLLTPLLRVQLARVERLDAADWQPTLGRDGRRGLALYRANIRPRLRSPAGPGTTRLPVTLVVPRYDRYVGPGLVTAIQRANPHAVLVDVDAGHWVQRTHPDLLADLVAQHVRRAAGVDPKVTEE